MELWEYWKIIRKRLLLIVVLGLIAAGGAAYLGVQSPWQYRTTTTLFLNPAAASALLPFQTTKTVQSVANTYIEFIRTRSFATLVAQHSGLALTPEQILESLTTQYVPDTQFFRISVTFSDPRVAQAIADTAALVLISENSARQQAEQAQILSQRSQSPELQRLTDLRDALQGDLKVTDARVADLQREVDSLELRTTSENNNDRLLSLREQLSARQLARAQTLTSLAQIQSTLAANDASANTTTDTAVVVDPAPLPLAPLPRNLVRQILIWLVVGLAAGVGIALGLERLDYTVKTPEALDAVYGIATQGVIGVVAHKRSKRSTNPNAIYQLIASDPRGPVAESIRALRTSVQVAGMIGPLRSLLITSAGPGEGKTFIAANLAVGLAQYGSRVILVDTDLRKPNVHSVFGLQRDPGFTNLIVGQRLDLLAQLRPKLRTIFERARNKDALRQRYAGTHEGRQTHATVAQVQSMLRDVESDDPDIQKLVLEMRRALDQREDLARYLQPTNVENLWVLACGAVPPNPAELLGSPWTAQVMEQLKEHADIVIYDSPPAATVTDATILAPRVDAVLQVVRAGSTRIDLVRRCKTVLGQVNARMLGPVLNQVRLPDLGYYSYYYNGYESSNGHANGNGHAKRTTLFGRRNGKHAHASSNGTSAERNAETAQPDRE